MNDPIEIKGNDFTDFQLPDGFDGDVIIIRYKGTTYEETMRLPMCTLELLVAEKIRHQRIKRLERMTTEQIIGDTIK